jgi:hypothetical protein
MSTTYQSFQCVIHSTTADTATQNDPPDAVSDRPTPVLIAAMTASPGPPSGDASRGL